MAPWNTSYVIRLTTVFMSVAYVYAAMIVTGVEKVEDKGDVSIVAYLGIQERDVSTSKKCGYRVATPGIMFFEGLRFALKDVNKNLPEIGSATIGYVAINTCKSWWRLRRNVKDGVIGFQHLGVIGPSTSDEAIFAAPIFSVFHMPVISHYATSIDLEDREKYGNFYRTVPSDRYSTQAFVDILLAQRWNYVSAVGSYGNYGQRGLDNFIFLAKANGICIHRRLSMVKNPTNSTYHNILVELLSDRRARVVVLFTSQQDTTAFLRVATGLNVRPGQFIWLANTQFRSAITPEIAHLADGAITLEIDSRENKRFKEYFLSLTPSKANYTWFHIFWEQTFGCNIVAKQNGLPTCSGKEKLEEGRGYDKSIPIDTMVQAINVYVCGFKKLIKKRCGKGDTKTCIMDWAFNSNYTLPARYMVGALSNDELRCNDSFPTPILQNDGGVVANFRIMNIKVTNRKITLVKIGDWNGDANRTSALNLFKNYSMGANTSTAQRMSSCSPSCRIREIKKMEGDHKPCCWVCQKCESTKYVFNNTCRSCPKYKAPNNEGGCKALPILHVSTSDTVSIVTLVFCFIGIKLTTVVLGVYLKYWDSRIVKAAGKELSSIMIIGLYMCFLTPIFFLSKPDHFICSVQRFVVGVSLTTCYTPLLLKTNRIYRIFKSAESAKLRPSFISPRSQVLICAALISIQVLFGVTWVVANPPHIIYLKTSGSLTMVCAESEQALMLNLGICCVMMVICTCFAFKTRNFPKNYNESRSIVLTMYLSCFLWGIFIPMFFFSKGVDLSRVYIICIFCIVIAYVTLIGLFESRVRLLLFPRTPKDDDRSTSTGYGGSGHANMKVTRITYEMDSKGNDAPPSAKKVHFHDHNDSLDKAPDTEVEEA